MEEKLQKQIDELTKRVDSLSSNSTIPLFVGEAFKERVLPEGFKNIPLASITAPTGGATVDGAARTAINSLITRLEDLDLIIPN